MAKFLFKYTPNKEEFYAVCTEQNNQEIIKGKKMDLLMKLVSEGEIQKARIENNRLVLKYQEDDIVVEDYDYFLKDDKYPDFKNAVKEYNETLVKENITRAKMKKGMGKLNIKHTASITGDIAKGTFIALFAYITLFLGSYTVQNIDNYINNQHYPIYNADNIVSILRDGDVTKSVNINPNSHYKVQIKNNKYSQIIQYYAEMYGIDYKIISSVMAQNNWSNERTMTSEGKIGITGLNYNDLIKTTIGAYNYKQNEFELYAITPTNIIDTENQIRIFCMKLQSSLRRCDNNLAFALEACHTSEENVENQIKTYAKNNDTTVKELLAREDTSWYNECFSENGEDAYFVKILAAIPTDELIKIRTITSYNSGVTYKESGAVYYHINNLNLGSNELSSDSQKVLSTPTSIKRVNLNCYSNLDNINPVTLDENNKDEIIEYANTYGLDPELIQSMINEHKVNTNENKVGIMNIDKSYIDTEVIAYNYKLNRFETFLITEDNIETANIKIGCMLLSSDLKYAERNIVLALEYYDLGKDAVDKVLRKYANITQLSVDNYRKSTNNLGWLAYLTNLALDRPDAYSYAWRVLAPFMNSGGVIEIKNYDGNATAYQISPNFDYINSTGSFSKESPAIKH